MEEPDSAEEIESELELDESGVIQPDHDEPLPMGDASVEVKFFVFFIFLSRVFQATEEKIEQADEKRTAAQAAFNEGTYQLA